MTREEKATVIKDLTTQLADSTTIYLADISGLDAGTTSELRRACFKANIKLAVVKNTLLSKAMDASDKDFGELPEVLKGNTSLMFSEVANAPAKLIKNFRKKSKKPLLKGAFVQEAIYIGDENLDALVSIKSKEEMIGEVIGLFDLEPEVVLKEIEDLYLKNQKLDGKSINDLIAQRRKFREIKEFANSDKIRNELKALGITLLDKEGGTVWELAV